MKKLVFSTTLLFLLIGCSMDSTKVAVLEANYEFETDLEGWEGGFADYPEGEETFYELAFSYSNLPGPLDTSEGAIKQSGNNHSDDLFMFIKRKLTGLTPNQVYEVVFDIEFATNVPDDAVGVGGSPGASVYIKAGMSTTEPDKQLDGTNYVMNIDKGNQSQGGNDMIVIGNFENGTDLEEYRLKRLTNHSLFFAQADENGELWAIIGTDSGFESTTTIYYNKITMYLIETVTD